MSIKEKYKVAEDIERRNSRNIYPGSIEAERQRSATTAAVKEEADWLGFAPNYAKFEGWTADEVLVWFNID